MAVPIIGTLLPIIITLGAFVMVVFLRKYENIERLKMIEHGMDPLSKSPRNRAVGLKFGLVVVGVGIGLLVGNVLDASGVVYEEVAYFSMAFIFGGIGLLVGYIIEARQIKKEQEKETERDV